MEIIRKNELQEILDLVKMIPHGKFLITGAVNLIELFTKYSWKDIVGARKENQIQKYGTFPGQ